MPYPEPPEYSDQTDLKNTGFSAALSKEVCLTQEQFLRACAFAASAKAYEKTLAQQATQPSPLSGYEEGKGIPIKAAARVLQDAGYTAHEAMTALELVLVSKDQVNSAIKNLGAEIDSRFLQKKSVEKYNILLGIVGDCLNELYSSNLEVRDGREFALRSSASVDFYRYMPPTTTMEKFLAAFGRRTKTKVCELHAFIQSDFSVDLSLDVYNPETLLCINNAVGAGRLPKPDRVSLKFDPEEGFNPDNGRGY